MWWLDSILHVLYFFLPIAQRNSRIFISLLICFIPKDSIAKECQNKVDFYVIFNEMVYA
jgi:hypothetical protein